MGFSTPFLPYSDVLTQGTNISKGDGNFPRAFMILRMASKSFPLEANYSLKGNTNSEPPNPSSLADPSIDVNNAENIPRMPGGVRYPISPDPQKWKFAALGLST